MALFSLHLSSILDVHKEKEQYVCSPEKFMVHGRCATLVHLSQSESFQIVHAPFQQQVTIPSALPA